MRYVRFMSVNELEKFKQGEVLRNNTDWSKRASSGSVGFCFLGDNVKPEDRIEYLTGVVCMNRVAVFEPIGGEPLRISQGSYRLKQLRKENVEPADSGRQPHTVETATT